MINSFKCHETEKIWNGIISTKIPNQIQSIARRKLRMIAASVSLVSLKIPPSNHLKKLKGKKSNQYSIRINDQWRICFCFFDSNAHEVEIVDYH